MNNPQWEEFSSLLPRLMEKQRVEEDQLILFFNRHMREALRLHQMRNSFTLLKNIEMNASEALKQKDMQISAANLQTQQLELNLQITKQNLNEWKNIVTEQLTTISSLEETLKRIDGPCSSSNEESKSTARLACKFCLKRGVCVVITPCGHLCACKECEKVVGFCPVCGAVKGGSIEVLFEEV
ncbi:hypothetical protein LUZ60_011911 [Juncus effusus]|nr:hypothetical protein LUZ60_011911 [Juncus effusus]